MKKILWSIFTIICSLVFSAATASHQGRIGYSNGPQEANCTACHTSYDLNSGSGSVSITSDMPGWQYVPGQTYTISLTVQQAGSPRFGFAFEANKDTGMIGTLTSMSPTDSLTTWRTRTIIFEGTQHVKYGMTQSRWNIAPPGQPTQYYYPATAMDTYTWNFKWTAPLTNEGLLTFYFTGVATDDSLEWDTTDDDYTYTGSQNITPAPAMTINCATNASEPACQSQSAINTSFFTWLTTATVSGGCGTVLTNDAIAAPLACGGSVLVTWTATSTCGPTQTCSATFTVDAASPVVLNCIGNQSLPYGQSQANVDAAYDIWLGSTNTTGGCNGVLTNNSTGAPLSTGGSVTVLFTVTSDCEADVTCSATFTVNPPPGTLTLKPKKLLGFTATLSVPSLPKTFTVEGTHLTDPVRVQAPAQFQISLTGTNGSWKNKLVFYKDANNELLPTTIYVRFKPTATGYVHDYVKVNSIGISQHRVEVDGTASARFADVGSSDNIDVVLSPNPVVNTLNFAVNSSDQNVTIYIYDLAGNKLQSSINNSSNSISMDVSQLPQGLYFCRIENGNDVVVKKFVKN